MKAPPLCDWKHDPSGQPMDYSVPLPVTDSVTVVSATMTAVDENDASLVGDTLTISNVSFALVSARWFVTFWASGGTPGMYRLRCRWALSDGRGSDTTMRLQCANT